MLGIILTLIFLAIGTTNAQTDPPFVFLATHSGYSWYKVQIELAKFPIATYPNLRITDDVVQQTCTNVGRGVTGITPCPSTALGCPPNDPFITLAAAVGCSQSYDPTCIRYNAASVTGSLDTEKLSGTQRGGLWINMQGAGPSSGWACGNHPFRTSGCADGSDFTVHGQYWVNSANLAPYGACGGCAASQPTTCTCVLPGGAGSMIHWALCVSKAVCKCVNGDCDLVNPEGYCRMGTCRTGWYGVLCNEPCNSAFCGGRSTPNGVRTTASNLCECTCTADFTPSGTGAFGTRCVNCANPGSAACTAYRATTMVVTTTVPFTVRKGQQFTIDLEARFSSTNGNQVDTTLNSEIITVTLNPGGGNGDGGKLTVYNSNTQIALGRITLVLSLSESCQACSLSFIDITSNLLPIVTIYNIVVTSPATELRLVTAPTTIPKATTFNVQVAITDSAGNKDLFTNSLITVSLQTSPLGGGGNGGTLTVAPPTLSFTQSFVGGVATWSLAFSRGCTACVLVFTYALSGIPVLYFPAIKVTTTATQLIVGNIVPTKVRRGEAFDVNVQAVDGNNDQDPSKLQFIVASLVAGGGNGDGGQLVNTALSVSLTQRLVEGAFRFSFTFTQSCRSCIIKISDTSTPALTPLSLPAIKVTSTALRLDISTRTPTEVKMGDQIQFTVRALDAAGNVDEMFVDRVTASLRPGGGSGDGGVLLAKPSPDLTQNMVAGSFTFYLSFTKSCTACIIEFTDVAQLLTKVVTAGISVSQDRVRLSLKTPTVMFTPRLNVFDVTVRSLDVNGNIDVKDTSRVTLSVLPNGGNGDGGVFSDVRGLQQQLVAGEVTFTPMFSKSCTLCVMQIAHEVIAIPTITLPGIEVRTTATRLAFSQKPPATIARKTPFPVVVQSIDEAGGIDTGDQGVITIRLRAGGGNGDGGVLRADGSVGALSKLLVKGVNTWYVEFPLACDACVLEIVDATNKLPMLVSDPILVSTAGTKLGSETSWTKNVVSTYSVALNTVYDLDVRVLDADGSVDTASTGVVTVALNPNGGNGNGEPMSNVPAGFSQPLVAGKLTLRLAHAKACDACVIVLTVPSLSPLTLPALRVTTTARRIVQSKFWPVSVSKGSAFDVLLQVVDSSLSVDRTWTKQIAVAKTAGGGNGDGGEVKNTLAANALAMAPTSGELTMRLMFTEACTSCVLVVSDLSGVLPPLTLPAVFVTTTTTAVEAKVLNALTTQKNVPFTVEVRALDGDGNTNTQDASDVSVRMFDTATAPSKEVPLVYAGGGRLQKLSNGITQYTVTVPSSCARCTLTTEYMGTGTNGFPVALASQLTLASHVSTDVPLPTPAPPKVTPAPPLLTPGPPITIFITPPPTTAVPMTPGPTPPPATPSPPTPTPTPTSTSSPPSNGGVSSDTVMYIGIAVGVAAFLICLSCAAVGCVMMARARGGDASSEKPRQIVLTNGGQQHPIQAQPNPIGNTFPSSEQPRVLYV